MPNFNIGKVKSLKAVHARAREYASHLKQLGAPVLTELRWLPKMYSVYLDVISRRAAPQEAQRVCNRKKFLLVALYLYSPRTLAGCGRMRTGLRDALSKLFGLSTSTPVSDNCSTLLFEYDTYRPFRRDVDILFDEITLMLRREGAVPEGD